MSFFGAFKGIFSLTKLINRILDMVEKIANKIKRRKREQEYREVEKHPTNEFIEKFRGKNDKKNK